ncbi:MAG: hypothetical protein SOR71_07910 [Oscillospiraceae bacterium]|nr:hypothetical protein [Oscillospiraceae bacterium]
MNWLSESISDLRLYGQRKRFLESVDSQLIWLENDFAALKGCTTDSEAVEGGASKSEDHLLNNIVKRDKLKQSKRLAKEFVEQVEKTLDMLPKQQKDILTEFFIDRSKGHIERLMEKYHVEQAHIYRLKNESLYSFTILRYGASNTQ